MDFLSVEKLDAILAVIDEDNQHSRTLIKSLLSADYSFGDIALSYILYYDSLKKNPSINHSFSVLTQYLTILQEDLNKQLRLFKGSDAMILPFATNVDLQKQFQQNATPHPILDQETTGYRNDRSAPFLCAAR